MSNIRKMAEQYFEDAVELRRRIHQQPELSMEEKETSALVREKLREYGISIAELPLETGVIGVLAGNGLAERSCCGQIWTLFRWRSGLAFPLHRKRRESAIAAARYPYSCPSPGCPDPGRDKEGFSRHSIISVPAGRREVERFPVGDRQRAV